MFLPVLGAIGEESISGAGFGDSRMSGAFLNWLPVPPDLLTILGFLLMFFTLKGIARWGLEYYRVALQQRFLRVLRLKNLDLLIQARFTSLALSNSGRIQNTLSGEVERVQAAFANYFQALQYVLMAAIYTVLAYLNKPVFALIVIGGAGLASFLFRLINRHMARISAELSAGTNNFQGLLIESVASFKFLKATGLMERYGERVRRSILHVEEAHKKIGLARGLATAVREPIVVAIVAMAIYLQVVVFGERLPVLLLSLLLFYRALTSFMAYVSAYNTFVSFSGSVANVRNFGEEMHAGREKSGTLTYQPVQDGIFVEGLTFGYGGHPVLRNLSVRIHRHTVVGLVGESGSGKTTLANLLCGLIAAPPATIRYDGIDINEWDRSSLRAHVGYVTQEPQVFADTIRNNVSFWDEQNPENDRRIWEVLEAAYLTDFVAGLPGGLDYRIGDQGGNLSGGQRQRLSIARELYRDVDLLIFDEATSALDTHSEQQVQENLTRLRGRVTMLVIAHRLSTLRQVDKIIYLRPDGANAIGTFRELESRLPDFRELVRLQLV